MNDDARLIKAALDRRFARAATPPCPDGAWRATTAAPARIARPTRHFARVRICRRAARRRRDRRTRSTGSDLGQTSRPAVHAVLRVLETADARHPCCGPSHARGSPAPDFVSDRRADRVTGGYAISICARGQRTTESPCFAQLSSAHCRQVLPHHIRRIDGNSRPVADAPRPGRYRARQEGVGLPDTAVQARRALCEPVCVGITGSHDRPHRSSEHDVIRICAAAVTCSGAHARRRRSP